jgi:NADH-quinone oxidoreductase subunit N
MVWLVVFAVLMAVIGAFYYLRIVKLMYFDEPKDKAAIKSTPEMRWALSLNALALLGLGLMPQSLMNLCAYAITLSLS